MTGKASIWWYLAGNCTDKATTAIEVNLNLALGGSPYASKIVYGYGFTGTELCCWTNYMSSIVTVTMQCTYMHRLDLVGDCLGTELLF